jgi:hypothetical protein
MILFIFSELDSNTNFLNDPEVTLVPKINNKQSLPLLPSVPKFPVLPPLPIPP